MHRKFEELNRVYADLVRKYREIEREKDQVNLEIEDTRRRYRAIEEEYGVLATKIEKYVNQMDKINVSRENNCSFVNKVCVNRNELLEVDVAILVLIVLGPNRTTVFIEGSCLLR